MTPKTQSPAEKATASKCHFAKLYAKLVADIRAVAKNHFGGVKREADALGCVKDLADMCAYQGEVLQKKEAELTLCRDELRRSREDLAFAKAAKLTPRTTIGSIEKVIDREIQPYERAIIIHLQSGSVLNLNR